MIGVSGLFMFFIALSIHFSININGTLIIMAIIIGSVATSRLHLKAHTSKELIIGIFIGFIPQLILVPYWL
jgi:ABC-type Mn2+/Zn2+ transport system permease subunit